MLRASLVLGLCAVAAPARADVLKLFAEAHGGAMTGTGTGGDLKDSAFFANAPHGDYGLLIGGEFLFIDVWIQHHQFTNGSDLATWTQFGLGPHFSIDLGSAEQTKKHKGPYFELGAGAWFGLGTGQQVMPPLDNAQISDKAFLVEGRVGFGTHLNHVFDLGIEVPVSWGYFFKNGNGAAVNDLSTHYQGVQGEALVVLRANLRIL
ncbi:MAG TPA: hypothetical protein VGM88_24730 [Kofleriaceae bacterium]|jgi:CubicO group peptidase (beta-lactamase class C family)